MRPPSPPTATQTPSYSREGGREWRLSGAIHETHFRLIHTVICHQSKWASIGQWGLLSPSGAWLAATRLARMNLTHSRIDLKFLIGRLLLGRSMPRSVCESNGDYPIYTSVSTQRRRTDVCRIRSDAGHDHSDLRRCGSHIRYHDEHGLAEQLDPVASVGCR